MAKVSKKTALLLQLAIRWVMVLAFLGVSRVPAQTQADSDRFKQIYAAARTRFASASTNVTAAWEFGRAAYDLADSLSNDQERSEVAQTGIDACRQAVSLDPNSAPAHYYWALNLGESARAKKVGALKILHEMELNSAKLLSWIRHWITAGRIAP